MYRYLDKWLFRYNLNRYHANQYLSYGYNLEIYQHLLEKSLNRMVRGGNKNTPVNCKFSIQNVCLEANIKVQNIYRSSYYFEDILEEIKLKEMERKKALLRKVLTEISSNLATYAEMPSFRLSMKYLLDKADLTKDHYRSLTISMSDLIQDLKQVQEQLRVMRKQLKKSVAQPYNFELNVVRRKIIEV